MLQVHLEAPALGVGEGIVAVSSSIKVFGTVKVQQSCKAAADAAAQQR